jgi:predicted RNA-binding protein YlqC (UPF0109 family)
MKDLALFLLQRLVDKPEAVAVEESGGGDTVLRLVVDPTDKGKVIGRQGKVINAIRSVIAIAAQKSGRRVTVQID